MIFQNSFTLHWPKGLCNFKRIFKYHPYCTSIIAYIFTGFLNPKGTFLLHCIHCHLRVIVNITITITLNATDNFFSKNHYKTKKNPYNFYWSQKKGEKNQLFCLSDRPARNVDKVNRFQMCFIITRGRFLFKIMTKDLTFVPIF